MERKTEKQALRKKVAEAELAMSPAERQKSDRMLVARLLSSEAWKKAESVMLFSPIGAEVRLGAVVREARRAGKRIGLPCMQKGHTLVCREWRPGVRRVRRTFGILEPGENCPVMERDTIDLILVPALCYDRSGVRLGHGAGYYDRYLAGYSGVTVGLCREMLLQQAVPADPWDVSVQMVITETESLE